MKAAIMQPYFLPYLGYFQLINAVDTFIVYDNIQYTKKGWINRNRYLVNGQEKYFTLPLKKDSDYLDICAREISDTFNRKKSLNALLEAYRKSPFFAETAPLLEMIYMHPDNNLFNFILHSINQLCNALHIETRIQVSSSISMDHALKGEQRVLKTCEAINANFYINPIGGIDLYDKNTFKQHGITLHFLKPTLNPYSQSSDQFIPGLSIIDLLMNLGKNQVRKTYLDEYTLI